MTSYNFEDKIKDKLEKREITPTDGAWNEISIKIGHTHHKKKGYFVWYGVAAGFIGFIMIMALVFNREDTIPQEQIQVVSVPEVQKELQEEEESQTQIKETESPEGILADPIGATQTRGKEPRIQRKRIIREAGNIAGLKAVDDEDKMLTTENPKQQFFDIKIEEVVAQVSLLESKNKNVTEAEVDSLLQRARQEMLADKIFTKDRTVDPMALLADVEDELDQSFRDQIFDALKAGFIKVRTAVADRDN